MKKRYFMGIDLAKATFDFCLLSENGSRLWQGRLSNDARGIEQFFSQLRARGWKLQQIHFGLEATGVYGKALVAALHQRGLAVSVLNPAQVKFFALSVLRRTKNDTVDAQVIARFCLERKPLATRPLRPIEEQLKLLVHERESRVGEQIRERNRAKKDPYHLQLPELISRQRQERLAQLKSEISRSLGAGADPLSLGSQSSKVVNSMTSLSAAPSCANSSTLPSAFLDTNNPLTPCWFLLLKPFDTQDRI
ncbi:MAG: IS110 family transposase [Chthoniobacterales bacterium]